MDLITLSLAVCKVLEELGVKTSKSQTTVFRGSPVADSSNWIIDFTPVSGKEYTVTVNGETTTQKAASYTDEAIGNCILLGNATLIGGEANGVEWYIIHFVDVEASFFAWVNNTEEDGTTTITITTETNTIHPIDPKFIPGAVLPVVEITSAQYAYDSDGNVVTTELSETESAQLTAAAKTGLPCVVKLDILVPGSNMVANATMVMTWIPTTGYYTAPHPMPVITGMTISIANNDGVWSFAS